MPNVSLCAQENEVHYNPYVVPPFFCKLTLQDDSVIEIEGSGELTQAMVSDVYKTTLVSAEIGNLCTTIGARAFSGCTSLTSITIPNSVTSIGNGAFMGCTSLTNITILDSVTLIEDVAFYACMELESVKVESETPPTLGYTNGGWVFKYRPNQWQTLILPKLTIYVPSESVETYKTAPYWGDYASQIQAISAT